MLRQSESWLVDFVCYIGFSQAVEVAPTLRLPLQLWHAHSGVLGGALAWLLLSSSFWESSCEMVRCVKDSQQIIVLLTCKLVVKTKLTLQHVFAGAIHSGQALACIAIDPVGLLFCLTCSSGCASYQCQCFLLSPCHSSRNLSVANLPIMPYA